MTKNFERLPDDINQTSTQARPDAPFSLQPLLSDTSYCNNNALVNSIGAIKQEQPPIAGVDHQLECSSTGYAQTASDNKLSARAQCLHHTSDAFASVEANSFNGQEPDNSMDIAKAKEMTLNDLVDVLGQVDLNTPPGLAGDICRDLAKMERRALPSLRPAVSLSVLSALCRYRSNIDGEKMSYFSIVIAESGAGKETHQRYIKQVMGELGLLPMLCGKPRSDKNILIDLFEHLGSKYVLDEVHDFLGKALSSKSASFESAMGDLLLELKTSSLYTLPGNLARELAQKTATEIEQLESKGALSESNATLLVTLKSKLNMIENGMPNPFLSLIGYSTHAKSDFIICPETILSGLIGRLDLWLGPVSERSKLARGKIQASPSEEVIERCKTLNGSTQPIVMSPESESLLELLIDYFEQDELLNHDQLGAIYARGVERVKNMASLLATECGIISPEMLLYSARIFIENANRCAEALTKKLSASQQQLLENVDIIVKRVTAKRGPVSLGILANHVDKCNSQIRKLRKESDDKYHYQLLNKLIERGTLIEQYGLYVHTDNIEVAA